MSPWLVLVLASAAVAQGARLIVNDSIIDQPRRWWTRRGSAWVVKLLSCPWCITAWLSAATTLGLALMGLAPLPALWWAATWRLGLILYWSAEALARVGVDKPITIEVEDE